jgi:hypothetical protein
MHIVVNRTGKAARPFRHAWSIHGLRARVTPVLLAAMLAVPSMVHAWTFSWLAPAPGDVSTLATAINQSGQVVGASRSGSLSLANDVSAGAVRWGAGAYSSGPDVISGLYPTNPQSSVQRRGVATAVNGAGSFTTSDGVLWTSSRGPQLLDTLFGPGPSAGSPVGIGASETIVGNERTGPYIWDSVNGRRDLGAVAGGFSRSVNGVSPNGFLAVGSSLSSGTTLGTSLFRDERVAVLWDQAGRPTVLSEPTRSVSMPVIPINGGAPGESLNLQTYVGRSGIAFAVNDFGEIVGSSGGQVGNVINVGSSIPPRRAVFWDRSGNPRLLDTRPGETSSEALALNGLGAAVGWRVVEQFQIGQSPYRAMLWDPVLGEVDLNELSAIPDGWQLTEAVGINDAGQIVGNGWFNGLSQGFVLTPDVQVVPLPPSAVLFIAGLLFFAGWTRRPGKASLQSTGVCGASCAIAC